MLTGLAIVDHTWIFGKHGAKNLSLNCVLHGLNANSCGNAWDTW